MPIQFKCDKCGRVLQTADDLAGKNVKCPSCAARLAVPVQVTEVAPDDPADIGSKRSGTGAGARALIIGGIALLAVAVGCGVWLWTRSNPEPRAPYTAPNAPKAAETQTIDPKEYVGARSVIEMDGKNGLIRVKHNKTLDLTTAMTAEAWIWAAGDKPKGAIATRDNPKIGPWQLLFNDDGKLRSDVAWGNWNNTPEAAFHTLATRTWLHVAMVFDGREVRNYVNGRKVASYPAAIKLAINDNDLKIGRCVYRGSSFNGRIAGFRLSGAALYDGDFAPAPRLIKLSSTALLLPLDEGEGKTAKDASDNGNDGTIENGAWATVSREDFRIR